MLCLGDRKFVLRYFVKAEWLENREKSTFLFWYDFMKFIFIFVQINFEVFFKLMNNLF